MDTTLKELGEFESGNRGTLKIGTVATPSSILLPNKLYRMRQRYPNVTFEVQTLRSGQIYESLKVGLIELGLLRTPLDHKEFDGLHLPSHPMVVAAAPALLREAADAPRDITFLRGRPVLINYRLEAAVTQACHNAGFVPDIFCRIDDARTGLLCASLGMGVTTVPEDWLSIIPGLAVASFPLDIPALYTNFTLIWSKERRLSSTARNFLELFVTDTARRLG